MCLGRGGEVDLAVIWFGGEVSLVSVRAAMAVVGRQEPTARLSGVQVEGEGAAMAQPGPML
jgi:hypothetical protein